MNLQFVIIQIINALLDGMKKSISLASNLNLREKLRSRLSRKTMGSLFAKFTNSYATLNPDLNSQNVMELTCILLKVITNVEKICKPDEVVTRKKFVNTSKESDDDISIKKLLEDFDKRVSTYNQLYQQQEEDLKSDTDDKLNLLRSQAQLIIEFSAAFDELVISIVSLIYGSIEI
jgi:hypothetical protein